MCYGESFEHYFLCHYKPLYVGRDSLSRSLIRFKNVNYVDVQAWVECSVEHLASLLGGKAITIVRALGSQELQSPDDVIHSKNPLDVLGLRLADQLAVDYKPEFLIKKRVHRPLKTLTWAEREKAVEDVYECKSSLSTVPAVLVIDDIMTTGTTLCAIIGAIRKKSNCAIYLYTLATSAKDFFDNSETKLTTPHYEWQSVSGWMVHEPLPPNVDVRRLKELIEGDFADG